MVSADAERTTYLLGAGFSLAAHSGMPLMDGLRDDVLLRFQGRGAEASDLRPFACNFESWLSYLATDQPWLKPADNLRNRALFYDIAECVFDVIEKHERHALSEKCPSWLLKLARIWMATSSMVATFNYDTLAERAFSEAGWLSNWLHLYAAPIRGVPQRGGATAMLAATPPDEPHALLVKLHGSTSWRYAGLDGPPSDAIYASEARGRWRLDTQKTYPTMLDDLQPMIVPPTGTKSIYYANHGLQTQWRLLAERLRASSELVIIGYSMPQTDGLVRSMIGGAFSGSTVTVVDPSDALTVTLTDWLPQGVTVQHVGGHDALADYVATLPDFPPPTRK